MLPGWAAGLAFANALLVPSAVAVAVGEEAAGRVVRHVVHRGHRRAHDDRDGAPAPLGGVGGHRAPRASGAPCGSACSPALALGLVGSVVWVAVAQLLVMSMDRAARDTAKLAELQQAASGWQASQAVRQRERRVRVQLALAVAGPVLTQVVAEGGALDEEEKHEARIAEGRLRDELRGARLLDDDVRDRDRRGAPTRRDGHGLRRGRPG